MNKSGLIQVVSEKTNLTKKKAEEVIDIVFSTMNQALINGERIELRGIGSFAVKNYNPYVGRNPKTGERIQVSSKKLPFFKVGKELREKVNY